MFSLEGIKSIIKMMKEYNKDLTKNILWTLCKGLKVKM
jgi:hypothetical protein